MKLKAETQVKMRELLFKKLLNIIINGQLSVFLFDTIFVKVFNFDKDLN
jgi:hypothetical protein